MSDLIQISVPYNNALKTKNTTIDIPKKPGRLFGIQKTIIDIVPIDEVQVWLDDGRIKHFDYSKTWILGEKRMAHFFFEDPEAAMLFKLTFS